MKTDNFMRTEFMSRSANEAYSRVAVAAFAAQLDPTLEQINEIKTAVSEAVTNAIVHGYRDKLGVVYISARIRGRKLTVTVRDKGCGIADVDRAMEPLFTTGNENERSGMGFTIMQSFMDRVRVRSRPGAGTKVTMEKTVDERG